ATKNGTSLEKERDVSAPSIKTSHLSLNEEAKSGVNSEPENSAAQTPATTKVPETTDKKSAADTPAGSGQDDGELIINNPYVKNASPDTADKTRVPSEQAQKDDQVMLTSGLTDEEFEEEAKSESDKKKSLEDDFEKEFNADDTGTIKQLLDTVKKPETVVRSAWSNSSARRYLLDNVDSYRAKDEDQNMEDVIEKVYGGKVGGKFTPAKFFKENLLFSFLIFLLIFLIGWKAAGILFPDVMPALNDQIIKTVQKTTTSKPVTQQEKKKEPVVTNVENKQEIDNMLSHCLITADGRNQLASAFTRVGYQFTNTQLTLSYEEVSDSIDVWEGMNMNFYIEDAIHRFRVLSKLSLPVVRDAQKAVSDYNQSLNGLKTQADELQNRIRGIQTAGGNQSTGTINKRIPLRNQLDDIKSRLAEEPAEERFTELMAKLNIVEDILTGQQKSNNVDRDEFIDSGQEWLVNIADTESTIIGKEIEEAITLSIKNPADKLKQATPNLTAFYLSELDTALNNALNLASLITYTPETRLKPYRLELIGLNRRLNKLMKNELPAWIGFDRCLEQKRTEVLGVLK
ncbi:MAG: hypothetical protein KAJ95_03885, partial [Gammaproteobacteria bacterium]|nr:hypothetical protein [Gammaproteobacteria bacterium]